MKPVAVIKSDSLVGIFSLLGDGITLSTIKSPQAISFVAGDTWALRITEDGVVSNPDVPTDEAAKAIFAAMEPYILGWDRPESVTRFEVIDETGRTYVRNRGVSVELSYQDDGRTLKVFVKKRE